MDRCIHILANYALRNKYGILIVVTIPRNESYENVTSKSKLSVECCRTICKNCTSLYLFANSNSWALVVTGILVCSLIFKKCIFINFV